MPEQQLCHCGKPLHYSTPEQQAAVERMIEEAGGDPYISVTVPDKGTYRVQRHYIALHGLKAAEIDELGFEKVSP